MEIAKQVVHSVDGRLIEPPADRPNILAVGAQGTLVLSESEGRFRVRYGLVVHERASFGTAMHAFVGALQHHHSAWIEHESGGG